VRIVGEALGVSLASMCACLNPEVVCIGGSVSELGDMLLKPTRMAFRRSAFATLKETPIEKALLRGNAGLVGAALLALDKC
jgi:singapore isolate B (sub-type 7) whole genome shotgun sequence assembly, scaffold_3